jgi:hypothetical protein
MKGVNTLSRTLVILALAATLSGPLLRAAEGADDLARSLGELGQPPLIEEVDGGVGDDSGAAVLADRRLLPHGRITQGRAPRMGLLSVLTSPSLGCLPQFRSVLRGEPGSNASQGGRRLAWIGRFLL